MKPTVEIVHDELAVMLPRYAAAMELSLPDAIRQTAKGVVSRVINITPPASAGSTGTSARLAGESKIKRDLSRVFEPKKLKGHRVIKVAFGHPMKTPVTVPTKELWPDVHQVYRQAVHGSAGRIGLRASRMRYVVDERKFAALLADKIAHVGRLASAWMASAVALGARVPAWVARHGTTRGDYREKLDATKPYVEIEARIPSESKLGPAMQRLLAYAMKYQQGAMVRRMRYLLAKKGEEAGFTHVGPMPTPPVDTDQPTAA